MTKDSNEASPDISSLASFFKVLEDFSYETRRIVETTQKDIEKSSNSIEELKKDFHLILESIKERHIEGIECNCRVENRSHEIQTRSSLYELWNRQKILENNLSKLEKFISSTMKRIDEVSNLLKIFFLEISRVRKAPHKCPICEGKGYWNGIENNISCGGRCNSCEGIGIIWGY